jgi:hypothetical protein
MRRRPPPGHPSVRRHPGALSRSVPQVGRRAVRRLHADALTERAPARDDGTDALSDGTPMEMKRLTGGNLRGAGYDAARRALVVELASGTFEYAGVSADTFRRLVSASSPWSFFRDNIDEEYPAKRIR